MPRNMDIRLSNCKNSMRHGTDSEIETLQEQIGFLTRVSQCCFSFPSTGGTFEMTVLYFTYSSDTTSMLHHKLQLKQHRELSLSRRRSSRETVTTRQIDQTHAMKPVIRKIRTLDNSWCQCMPNHMPENLPASGDPSGGLSLILSSK